MILPLGTAVCLILASATAAEPELSLVPVLNQFGAEAKPTPTDPKFIALDRFMRESRPGGTLRLGHNEAMISIFPTAIRDGNFKPRAPLAPDFLFETLMTLDPRQDDNSVYPLVLRELWASRDFCRLRVDLRHDVRFTDGTQLDAELFAESVRRFTDEFFSGAMSDLIHRLFGTIRVATHGKLTLDVRFTDLAPSRCRQAAYFFTNGVPIVKSNPNHDPHAEVDQPFIGTGPYRVAAAGRSLMRLEKDPGYWAKDHPARQKMFNPDAVEVRSYLDPLLERFALLRGEINLMRETQFTYDAWMKDQMDRRPIFRVNQDSDELGSEVGAVWMNQDHPHTGDINFRRALLVLWDLRAADRDYFAGRRHSLRAPGFDSELYPNGRPSADALEVLDSARSDQNYTAAIGPAEQLTYARLAGPHAERARLRLALDWLHRGGYAYGRAGSKTVLMKDGRPVVITAIARQGSPELKLFLRFQSQLRWLGIELRLKEFADRTALVAALQANQYDLYPGSVSVARDFTALNQSYLLMELHSTSRGGLGAWGRVNSPMIDVSLDALGRVEPTDPKYKSSVEAFVRALNANVPFLLSGELDPVVTYAHREVSVWKNRNRDLWTAYINR